MGAKQSPDVNLGLLEEHFSWRQAVLSGRSQAIADGASWMGTWIERKLLKRLMGFATADVAMTVAIDHSLDGLTADYTETVPIAASPVKIDLPLLWDYFRLSIVNASGFDGIATANVDALKD